MLGSASPSRPPGALPRPVRGRRAFVSASPVKDSPVHKAHQGGEVGEREAEDTPDASAISLAKGRLTPVSPVPRSVQTEPRTS